MRKVLVNNLLEGACCFKGPLQNFQGHASSSLVSPGLCVLKVDGGSRERISKLTEDSQAWQLSKVNDLVRIKTHHLELA